MLNLDGEKVETEEDIKEVYQNFYEKLLTETNKKVEESSENEKMAETIKKFEEIMEAIVAETYDHFFLVNNVFID